MKANEAARRKELDYEEKKRAQMAEVKRRWQEAHEHDDEDAA